MSAPPIPPRPAARVSVLDSARNSSNSDSGASESDDSDDEVNEASATLASRVHVRDGVERMDSSLGSAALNASAAAARALADEEDARFTLDLSQLSPDAFSPAQQRCICHVVACCLPRAAPLMAMPHTEAGSDALLQAQLGLGAGTASGDEPVCPVPTTWELRFLLLLLQYMSIDPLTLVALQPLLGAGIDPSPFFSSLRLESYVERMRLALLLLHFSVVALGGYDARVRALLRTLCQPALLDIRWSAFCRQENRYAALLAAQAEAARLEEHARKRASRSATAKKWLKVGAAGTVAGALLFVTGGLAAPAIGAGLASLGITGLAGGGVFLASTAGVMLVASIFGATGAGLVGYKLNRRISSLKEFRFERLSGVVSTTGGGGVVPTDAAHQCMSVQLCLNGWLSKMGDYHDVWLPLLPGRVVCSTLLADDDDKKSSKRVSDASSSGSKPLTAGQLLRREDGDAPSEGRSSRKSSSSSLLSSQGAFQAQGLCEYSEVYTLRWESECLLRFGEGLRDISGKDVAQSVATVGLQQTALKGLVVAIAWPVLLLQAGDLIDHPWLVVLNRCALAGIELANAIEKRVAGRRPISIVAYSMGARVVFLALEELARRKRARAKARAEAAHAHNAAVLAAASPPPPGTKVSKPSFVDRMRSKATSSSKSAAAHGPDPNLPRTPNSPADDQAKKKSSSSKSSSSSSSSSSWMDPSVEDADGAILDVFLFGAPVPADLRRWRRVRSMVTGRLVNGYSKRDWTLRFIYPLTTASAKVAGLMPIRDKQSQQKSKEERELQQVQEQAQAQLRRQDTEREIEASAQRADAAASDRSLPLASSTAGSAIASSSSSSQGSVSTGPTAPVAGDVPDADLDEDEWLPILAAPGEEDTQGGDDEAEGEESRTRTDDDSQQSSRPAYEVNAPLTPGAPSRPSDSAAAASSSSSSSGSAASSSARMPAACRLPSMRWCGIESVNCSTIIKGHRDYMKHMDTLLNACGYQP